MKSLKKLKLGNTALADDDDALDELENALPDVTIELSF